MDMLEGKCIVLGVTGSIAAYKIANLASMLKKQHADVEVIMTKNATNFINPITFETLTGNKCLVDTFDRNFSFSVEHIAIAKKADLFLVAPASANVIAKMAHGIADDMLTTTILACKCPKIVSPAMNTGMFENQIVQDNLETLRKYGMQVIEPANGYLACGDSGAGKMPEPDVLLQYILRAVAYEKDLAGKHLLVTAGPTREAIDPVRFISNHSTGRMGYAIAKMAMLRGADVTLISGPVALEPPMFVKTISVESAQDMYEAVMAEADDADIIIKSAAVADYAPADVSQEKIKKTEGDAAIPLVRTKDILAALGEKKRDDQFICGFAMETEHLLENAKAKREKKKVDMIVANSIRQRGAGFGGDTNVATLITGEGMRSLPLMSKEALAMEILDEAARGLHL